MDRRLEFGDVGSKPTLSTNLKSDMMNKIRRALISVFDKTGIVELATVLKENNFEIISTGGTAKHLKENDIETRSIIDVTGFSEILGGRLKTLHPKIFGGLLSLRGSASQMEEVNQHNIDLIDLVVVNLYPFEQTILKDNITTLEALENIDIGGTAIIRAAAKNYLDVTVVTSPSQYETLATEIKKNNGETSNELRKTLAVAAFKLTSRYDSCINNYLNSETGSDFSEQIEFQLEKVQSLRYGENPHQRAAFYRRNGEARVGLVNAKQLHGKELSFNNLIDLDAALGIMQEFSEPCVVVIKHTNPCGVATAKSLLKSYLNAKATDPVSSFGGVVGLNRPVDNETAQAILEVFTEAIIAPGYEPNALETLSTKKNLRLLEAKDILNPVSKEYDIKQVQGGLLLQDQDFFNINDINFKVVTKRQPTEDEWTALKFGWRVCKWVKSNAIVYGTKDRTIGIGAGQMSRIDSSKIAVEKAKRMGLSVAGTSMASDAFFPFRDGIDEAAKAGARSVIQPGGSIRDEEVIQAADEHDMAMVFTGVRHFRH